MPERFYFDLVNGKETIRDEEGVEADGVDEALIEARSVIAEMADEEANTDLSGPWTMIVRDAAGAVVGRLSVKP